MRVLLALVSTCAAVSAAVPRSQRALAPREDTDDQLRHLRLPRFSREEEKSYVLVGGSCMGLADSMCEACPAGEGNDCEGAGGQCKNSFCNPLCLSNSTWSCTLQAKDGMEVEDGDEAALCAQFRGWACKTQFECCGDEDEALTNWVHRQGVGSVSPASARPPLPIARCIHDAYNEAQSQGLCTKCKSKGNALVRLPGLQLQLVWDVPEDACERYLPPGAPADADTSGSSLKLLHERCVDFIAEVKQKLPDVIRKSNELLCSCAGCCDAANPPGEDADPDDGECPFPIYGMV